MKDLNLIELTDLEKRYGKKEALTGINLTIGRGKIIGLLGPNGSGKTTLIKLLNGLLQPTSGEIKVNGKAPGVDSKKIISYLPDKMYFADWMKIADLMDFFEDFYEDFDRKKAEGMCETLKINTEAKIKSLSKGNKEKVQLVLVMCRKAQLYLLDEPIAGVDPAARDFILDTILNNYNEEGTVIISTHLIADIEKIMDEVIFIKEGNSVDLSCREYCDHYHLSYCYRSDINKEIESGVGKIEGIRRGGKIMLRKLMKYDLKYYRKIMLPLWAVLIIYGIVHGINTVFNYETFYDHIPIKAQAIVVVTGIYFIFCVNIILVIQRFWKSMYGKESYLTHTLPVTERKLILSKVFSAIIISFTTVFIFFAENDILIYIQSIVYHGEASLQGIPIRHFQDFTKTKVVLTILYMIIYGIIWTMHLIYQAYTAICIGQMRSKNRFATMIIVGAFLFLVGYEMQVVLLQHNRYYSWFYLPCLIAFLVEIVLCHLVIEFILTRKLNIN